MSTRISFLAMNRLRPNEFEKISSKVSTETFTETESSGFLISKQSASAIEGRYAQKISDVLRVTDPFGHTFEYPRVTFLEQRFLLSLKVPQLILINPNSAGQALVGRLLEYTDFSIAAEPILFSMKDAIKEISERFTNLQVYTVSIDEFQLDDNSTARISVESSKDARIKAREFLKPRKFEFCGIKCQFDYADRTRRCELKSNGSVTIYGESDPLLEDAITKIVCRACGKLP